LAAESYLNGISLANDADIITRLKLGNNNPLFNDPSSPTLSGRTRFVDLAGVSNANQTIGSAQAFVSRYQIVDHHANDASGFSATLMRDTTTGEYTLSFRSTEFKPAAQGGDKERDAFQADADIGLHGFAFGQLAAMEEYFAQLKQGLKSDGTFDVGLHAFFGNPTHQLNVTGYSLGGHLATIFTELHESRTHTSSMGPVVGMRKGRIPVLPPKKPESRPCSPIFARCWTIQMRPTLVLPARRYSTLRMHCTMRIQAGSHLNRARQVSIRMHGTGGRKKRRWQNTTLRGRQASS
jgi:hypothetical protein